MDVGKMKLWISRIENLPEFLHADCAARLQMVEGAEEWLDMSGSGWVLVGEAEVIVNATFLTDQEYVAKSAEVLNVLEREAERKHAERLQALDAIRGALVALPAPINDNPLEIEDDDIPF